LSPYRRPYYESFYLNYFGNLFCRRYNSNLKMMRPRNLTENLSFYIPNEFHNLVKYLFRQLETFSVNVLKRVNFYLNICTIWIILFLFKKSLKIPESVNRRTDNTKTKRKRTKGKTTIYKTLHSKIKIGQQNQAWSHVLRGVK
jgi:hypothetical protein